MPSCAELFTGCGGLALGLERAGFTHSWFCESDPACCEILRRRFPGVPIVEDVRDVGRVPAAADAEPARLPRSGRDPQPEGPLDFVGDPDSEARLDLLAGGFPCQPFSAAGKRRGEQDDRYLWPEFARTIRLLRPRTVLLENVPGILSLALDSGEPVFGRVLADLAEAGYDTEWFCVRASDVGAPHRRERVFLIADADGGRREQHDETERGFPVVGEAGGDAADAQVDAGRVGDGDSPATTDPTSTGCSPGRGRGRREANGTMGDVLVTDRSETDWGIYEPAIRRWETITRPAPRPTDDRGRLNPYFVEWVMGLPDGWTEGVTRTARLRMLGNAVVPQVAELIGRTLNAAPAQS